MDRSVALQEITRLIDEIYGVKDIRLDTSLNSFNAVSEDNDEFLRRFQTELNVDMTGFDYYDFFYEDQFILLSLVRPVLTILGKKPKKKELTIDHLVNVAMNHKWEAP